MQQKMKLIGLFAATMLAGSGSAWADSETAHHTPHWAYSGEGGPANWGDLKDDYAACGRGSQQSPIDIRSDAAISADLGAIQFNYKATPLKVLNNGHTVQVNYAPGSSITVAGKTYQLLQFHFHTPSEHMVDGEAAPMELHFVHRNDAGDLAVVGVMTKKGQMHEALQPLWDHLSHEINVEMTVPGMHVDAAALLPRQSRDYYHYMGSLTTPPCSEIVSWFVLKEPIVVSETQVARFIDTIGANARPVQAINRRLVVVTD